MKSLILCLLAVFAFLPADTLHAQQQNEIIRSKKLLRDFVPPPNYEAGAKLQMNNSYKAQNWLVVIFEYTTSQQLDPDPAVKGKNGRPPHRWLDDVTFELYIAIPGIGAYGNILLSGTQKIWSLALDGKVHHVMFAVPPAIFQRYSKITEFNKSKAESLPMYLVVKNKSQQQIAFVTSEKRNPIKDSQIQRIFTGMINNFKIFKIQGAALPKEKTPWQWLETESFDMPKSMLEVK